MNNKEEILKTFVWISSKNSASGERFTCCVLRVAVSLLKDCSVQLVLRRNGHESFNGVLDINGKCILLFINIYKKSQL